VNKQSRKNKINKRSIAFRTLLLSVKSRDMLAIETSINLLWLPTIAVIAAFAGYIFRSKQIKRAKKRILSLENEMLSNHAEILKLQQELVELQKALSPYKTRVVNFKESIPDDKIENPQVGAQKKVNQ
jgi:hypothetical protein